MWQKCHGVAFLQNFMFERKNQWQDLCNWQKGMPSSWGIFLTAWWVLFMSVHCDKAILMPQWLIIYHCAEGLLTAQWSIILLFKYHHAEGSLSTQLLLLSFFVFLFIALSSWWDSSSSQWVICLCAEGLLTAQWSRIFLFKLHFAEGLLTAQWLILICHHAEGFLTAQF